MEGIGREVKEHLTWRFGEWFGEEELLDQVGGPMIKDIKDETGVRGARVASSRKGSGEEAPKMVLYSCHDVSLLGILYKIKAEVVGKGGDKGYWPDYGSWIR